MIDFQLPILTLTYISNKGSSATQNLLFNLYGCELSERHHEPTITAFAERKKESFSREDNICDAILHPTMEETMCYLILHLTSPYPTLNF